MPRKLPIAILPVTIAALFLGECLLAARSAERVDAAATASVRADESRDPTELASGISLNPSSSAAHHATAGREGHH